MLTKKFYPLPQGGEGEENNSRLGFQPNKNTEDSMNINTNYDNLEQSYLFSTIAKKVNEFISNNPDKKVIRLGIGDVTLPLCKVVVEALHKAVDEMGVQASFRGYGP